ncbi:putative reverse transcriptase domain-containing protein, partial [Tanacetum coccineum]
SSRCPTQIQTLRIASTQALIDAVTTALLSTPLPPLPLSLYIPPPVDRKDDVLESELPPRKRLCLSTLDSRYKIGESFTAMPTGDPAEAVSEIAHMTVGEVNTRVTELVELHEPDTQDLYALLEDAQDALRESDRKRQAQMVETLRVMRDMRREMSDMQAKLLAHREQQRRARQPGPYARIPDNQDASRDADSHIYSTNRDTSHSLHGDDKRNVQIARPCFYADFMKCQPLNFKESEGVVGLTRWIEKMESVFNISGYAIENQIRTLGPEAYSMTCEVLKKKMTDKYCPHGEIKKLEIELWNLNVKRNDVPAYTERFQELTLIYTKFVANETEKVDKYISGLLGNIYGNVKSARPKTLDETVELANDLMDQKLRTYAERQFENKRKAGDSSRNNHGHQQQPFKRQNVARVYNMGTGEKKLCEERVLATQMLLILRRAMGQIPREMVVLNVELQDISREIVKS